MTTLRRQQAPPPVLPRVRLPAPNEAGTRGMSTPDPPTRDGVPLRDRPQGHAPQSPAPQERRRRRHCWVDLTEHSTVGHAGEVEGLVLQWGVQDARGWVALVTYVIPSTGGDVTVQGWLPAARLRPEPGQK